MKKILGLLIMAACSSANAGNLEQCRMNSGEFQRFDKLISQFKALKVAPNTQTTMTIIDEKGNKVTTFFEADKIKERLVVFEKIKSSLEDKSNDCRTSVLNDLQEIIFSERNNQTVYIDKMDGLSTHDNHTDVMTAIFDEMEFLKSSKVNSGAPIVSIWESGGAIFLKSENCQNCFDPKISNIFDLHSNLGLSMNLLDRNKSNTEKSYYTAPIFSVERIEIKNVDNSNQKIRLVLRANDITQRMKNYALSSAFSNVTGEALSGVWKTFEATSIRLYDASEQDLDVKRSARAVSNDNGKTFEFVLMGKKENIEWILNSPLAVHVSYFATPVGQVSSEMTDITGWTYPIMGENL